MTRFQVVPKGPFDLETQARRFGGWPRLDDAVVIPFPVEGWTGAAAVVMRQQGERVIGHVYGTSTADAARAWEQALSTMSLDVDGTGFARVTDDDPVIGRLDAEFHHLRPVLFHSPYEAACAFVIGHRITMRQGRQIRQKLAEQLGEAIDVEGQTFHAFPAPATLLELDQFPGIPVAKVERLHAVARAALDGMLDRKRLRSTPEAEALKELMQLPGIGAFFAQGILIRGAGLVDAVTDDDLTPRAIQLLYGLRTRPTFEQVLERAEAWRPFRMWAVVLLNVWLRSQPADVIGRRQIRSRPK